MPSPAPDSRDSPPRRRERSRSRSPRRDNDTKDRPRSRSPPRGPKPKSYSGLKWKKPDRRDDDGDRGNGRGGGRFQDRDRYQRDHRNDARGDRGDRRDYRDDRRDDRRGDRRDYRDDARGDRRGGRFDSDRPPARDDRERRPRADAEKEKKPMAAPVVPGQEMIIVTVNDRLGTKAQIPCLASDPIKLFKAMVAAKIGRAPHEIMLKRQGERPMKDQLTLEDYGVSNGVQLDLELDTGD